MPTINQLVRQGRTKSVKKSNSPALLRGMNSLKVTLDGIVTLVRPVHQENAERPMLVTPSSITTDLME